ncbi:hypothetical protein EJ110_NYTH28108, partial [Nymphaea thermarum]
AAKKHLSSRIDRVDANLDECTALTAATKDEVSQLRGDLSTFVVDIESVHHAVQCLETKIGRIEEKQDFTNDGVHQLCVFVQQLEERRHAGSTQGSPSSSSRPALESPSVLLSTSRTISLPSPRLAIEPACTSQETPKDLQEISDLTKSSELEEAANGAVVSDSRSNMPSNSSSSSGRSGWSFPVLNASFITRTRSATYSFR